MILIMQREIPFRKIRQASPPAPKRVLRALAHGFLFAVCQPEDQYKGGFFLIKIKPAWTAKQSNIQI